MNSEEIKQLDKGSFLPTYGRFDVALCSRQKTPRPATARARNTLISAAGSA